MKEVVDNRGTILEVGQEVAYNLSGEIAHGKIIEIRTKVVRNGRTHSWSGQPNVEIKVKVLNHRHHHHDHISKVTSNYNVLVIS